MNTLTVLIVIVLSFYITPKEVLGFIIPEDPDGRKCKYSRVNKMRKVRCYDMHLKEVPQYLTTSVDIMDLTYNRIKKLRKNSFQRYSDVRYLLLYENMIQFVELGTFAPLTSLEEIDLSNNALTTIPMELFNLPSLRNLYIDSNELINIKNDLQLLHKPIFAPLEYLNIADCGLHDIPDLGILPHLWHLNASLNPLDEISVKQFSSLCHLKSVDLKDNEVPYCDCQILVKFFAMQGIKTSDRFDCDTQITRTTCPDSSNITLYTNEYQACNNLYILDKAKNVWIMIASGLTGVLLLILIILYCLHRKNVKKAKMKRRAEKAEMLQNEVKQEPLMGPT